MSEKKIGILSMNYRRNYGGVLQSYALYRVIRDLGYDVEVITFEYNATSNRTIAKTIDLIKGKFARQAGSKGKSQIVTRKLPLQHIEAFLAFKKEYLHCSAPLNNDTIGSYVSKYDAIVVGSDQVWNDVEGRHLYYFFDFGKSYHGKKIAYAPCSIVTVVPDRAKAKLKKQILKIDALSVRDATTQRLVSSVAGVTPEIVLDPTVLYDFNEFTVARKVESDYVFTYILGSEIEGGHKAVLEKIFEKYGKMKVVAAIIPDISTEVEKFADEVMYNASPDEWVNLVAHAKFVYTDSFHGCVFAMKFHKPFFAYYREASRASRLVDLRDTYHLPCIYPSGDKVSLSDLDYERIDAIIEEQRKHSLQFIKNSLP